jgi:hypothetical protein
MGTAWQDVDARLVAALHAQPPRIPVLVGGDGCGRTCLLRRVQATLGTRRAQYVDLERITSTPERFAAILAAHSPFDIPAAPPEQPGARAGLARALAFFAGARAAGGGPAVFLLDEWLEWRVFEHFPGLKTALADILAGLAVSPNRFALATRYVTRGLRVMADAPDRFTVMTVPALGIADIAADLMRRPGLRSDAAEESAQILLALTGGRAAYVRDVIDAGAAVGVDSDPVAALAAALAPGGPLDRRCRASYDARLRRARGDGALKAVLGVLAAEEPLTLTELAAVMGRTPGSTRDYLWWLEDVDLVVARRKRYAFADPLLRVWAGLAERPDPPGEAQVAAAVQRYALARLSAPPPSPPSP